MGERADDDARIIVYVCGFSQVWHSFQAEAKKIMTRVYCRAICPSSCITTAVKSQGEVTLHGFFGRWERGFTVYSN